MRFCLNMARRLIEAEEGGLSATEALIFLCFTAAVIVGVRYAIISQTVLPASQNSASSVPSAISFEPPWPELAPRKPLNWEQTDSLKR